MLWYFAIVAVLNLALGYALAKMLGAVRTDTHSFGSLDDSDSAAAAL